MTRFSVEVRTATPRDVARCEHPSQVSLEDGAAAVVVDEELVAVTNEYGTALLVPGSEPAPTREIVEAFVEQTMLFMEKVL